jgi:predicted DNA-binding protein
MHDVTTKRNTVPDIVTSIRLTPEQHDRLREIAASKHRSMAGELRMVIEAHIAANTPVEAAA